MSGGKFAVGQIRPFVVPINSLKKRGLYASKEKGNSELWEVITNIFSF